MSLWTFLAIEAVEIDKREKEWKVATRTGKNWQLKSGARCLLLPPKTVKKPFRWKIYDPKSASRDSFSPPPNRKRDDDGARQRAQKNFPSHYQFERDTRKKLTASKKSFIKISELLPDRGGNLWNAFGRRSVKAKNATLISGGTFPLLFFAWKILARQRDEVNFAWSDFASRWAIDWVSWNKIKWKCHWHGFGSHSSRLMHFECNRIRQFFVVD